MSTTETSQASSSPATPLNPGAVKNVRRKKKVEGRKKRVLKLNTDKEYAKQYFAGKAKRAADKKSAFRKKKSKKK